MSVSPDGKSAGDSGASSPVLSASGRYVVFDSGSSNLGADTGGAYTSQVYRRDLTSATTELVSVGSDGKVGDGLSDAAVISADGRFIAFETGSTNFVGADFRQSTIVVRRDMQSHSTDRVSGDNQSGDVTISSFDPHMTPDGRFVGYESTGQMTADPIDFGTVNIYVRDIAGGGTTLASTTSGTGFGIISYSSASDFDMSSDGSKVLFFGSDGPAVGAYVSDLSASQTTLLSVNSQGTAPARRAELS